MQRSPTEPASYRQEQANRHVIPVKRRPQWTYNLFSLLLLSCLSHGLESVIAGDLGSFSEFVQQWYPKGSTQPEGSKRTAVVEIELDLKPGHEQSAGMEPLFAVLEPTTMQYPQFAPSFDALDGFCRPHRTHPEHSTCLVKDRNHGFFWIVEKNKTSTRLTPTSQKTGAELFNEATGYPVNFDQPATHQVWQPLPANRDFPFQQYACIYHPMLSELHCRDRHHVRNLDEALRTMQRRVIATTQQELGYQLWQVRHTNFLITLSHLSNRLRVITAPFSLESTACVQQLIKNIARLTHPIPVRYSLAIDIHWQETDTLSAGLKLWQEQAAWIEDHLSRDHKGAALSEVLTRLPDTLIQQLDSPRYRRKEALWIHETLLDSRYGKRRLDLSPLMWQRRIRLQGLSASVSKPAQVRKNFQFILAWMGYAKTHRQAILR